MLKALTTLRYATSEFTYGTNYFKFLISNFLEPVSNGEINQEIDGTVDCEEKVTDPAEDVKPIRRQVTTT